VAIPEWQRERPEHPEPEQAEREQEPAEQAGAERRGVLPIFESVESEYPRPLTGLPQRIPQARQASGTAADQAPRPAGAGSAETSREQLASFQRGSRRARAVVEEDPETKQRARDH
jgi:hypothetical protein